MKSIDLRIGNYLHDRENRLCKVEKITIDGFKAPAIYGPITGLPNKPIELTEKWMLKMGFSKLNESSAGIRWGFPTKKYGGVIFNSDGFIIQFFKENSFKMGEREFKYVHEVQNYIYEMFRVELNYFEK